MTDFSTSISISRDNMVEMLHDDDQEQAAYALAELASRMERDSRAYRDFAESMSALEDDQKDALNMFCAAIVEDLNGRSA